MSNDQSTLAVQPYLFFGGRCEEALEFYGSVMGAKIISMMRFSDAPEQPPGIAPGNEKKVMHASVRVGQTTFMASDGRCEGEPGFEGFTMSVTVPNDAEAERVFGALSDSGKVEMPLMQTFWTSKFGMLEDKFGVGWMVSVEHKPEA
ncbi:MAG: VOC family protein [Chthoniobacterales bacterium]|jgi:PhnB protein